jgi:hypothetical protein
VGAALYQLDAAALEAEEPALHAQFRDHLDEDHWLGCVIRPNSDSNSDMLMDALHTRRAKGAFDVLWATSHAL